MATNDKIHTLEDMVGELYDSRNEMKVDLTKVATKLELLTEQNEKLIQAIKDNTAKFIEASESKDKRFSALVWKVVAVLVVLFGATLFAVIYGAIGKDGLKSVRETMPNLPSTISRGAIDCWHDPLRGFLVGIGRA